MIHTGQTVPVARHGFVGTKIQVVGTTGSGKTTSARCLAERLGLRHVEIDALFWKPDWQETPDAELLAAVEDATRGDRWVVDGNYSRTRSISWPRADTLIWLDYRFCRVFWQLLVRTVRRSFTREVLWGGCRESLGRQFFSRDSILLWCLKTYWKRRRNFPKVLARPEHAHLHVFRFRSPRAFRRWASSLAPDPHSSRASTRHAAVESQDVV